MERNYSQYRSGGAEGRGGVYPSSGHGPHCAGGARQGGRPYGAGRPERGDREAIQRTAPAHGTAEDLRAHLRSIDHRGYPAYKDLTGQYQFGGYVLSIDHVQGDPFAAPSSLSIHIKGEQAGFPARCLAPYENRRALQDDLIRRFHRAVDQYTHKAGGSGKSGLIACTNPGQEILDRSACQIDPKDGSLVFRFSVGFPAAGRTILAGELEKILFDYVPACVSKALMYHNLPAKEIEDVIDLAEDQKALRQEMDRRGLVAFIADGSILPRESGISQRPMQGAVSFRSSEEDRIAITLPHKGEISGMGIRRGVTLIIGGGYHGKSTLLQALERCVYDHIRGDGREYVMTEASAVKIRAEDGRVVMKDDISPFIRDLPNGKDTSSFSTEDASGSTSQAAAVTEAVESGAKVLLMDEDTCATNFMVRDALMQRIVAKDAEPIIPFSQLMQPLYKEKGISTILVAGSSGAFFGVSDTIIQMNCYVPYDVTEKVRGVLRSLPSGAAQAKESSLDDLHTEAACADQRKTDASRFGSDNRKVFPGHWDFSARCPRAGREFDGRDGRVKTKNLGRDGFMIGHGTVDLRLVEQIVDPEQTEMLAQLTVLAAGDMDGKTSVQQIVKRRMAEVRSKGFGGAVKGRVPGNLAMVRPQELYATLNRCRLIRMV